MSKIIPNSFQTPNAYVDEFMAFLTPEEYVVLSYAARRVLGFHKESDHISLSQFSEGLTRDGVQLDYGTGLNKQTVRKALDALMAFGLILQLRPYEKETSTPALFALQLDYDGVDVEGLRRRREERIARDSRRTQAATAAMHPVPSDKTPPVTSDERGVIGPPITSHVTPLSRPTTDPLLRPTEGQKKEEKHRGNKDSATPTAPQRAARKSAGPKPHKRDERQRDPRGKFPAIQLVKQLTGYYPRNILYDKIIEVLGDHPDFHRARECATEWAARGFRMDNHNWIFDWYVNGIPEAKNGNGSGQKRADGGNRAVHGADRADGRGWTAKNIV